VKPLLGAHVDEAGAHFAVESTIAETIELAVFGPEERRFEMRKKGSVFTLDIDLPVGTEYGYRVHGPWDPRRGLYSNPAKLLCDPYAHHVSGSLTSAQALVARTDDGEPDQTDSAPFTLRSILTAPIRPTAERRPPTPASETVIYETHVKGLTYLHPGVPAELRGKFLGVSHSAVVEHLVGLGVTAVELLPVQQFVPDWHLLRTGRVNYWGYNPVAFAAPHRDYAVKEPVAEFRQMTEDLHLAGIDVILDVVFNHTAEGGSTGPTICHRGLDNPAWYRLDYEGEYINWTGTGNTIDATSPTVTSAVIASLRRWMDLGADGFRFDLATILGRTADGFSPGAEMLERIRTEFPDAKLIAEPWDLGPGGYRLGGFGAPWSEWNDRFRDTVRDFWRGTDGVLADLASRINGSSDIFESSTASVNFVTSHDGFTLRDLVSYNRRHNHANGENNRDGHQHNRSWNTGVEGPTADPAIEELRARRVRSMLATLLLSAGIPMLNGGDELGRTQLGNNNAYNQDNRVSWYQWEQVDRELLDWVRRLGAVRARGHRVDGPGTWLSPDGTPMNHWADPLAKAVMLLFEDDELLLCVNGSNKPAMFSLPGPGWSIELESAEPGIAGKAVDEILEVAGFGLVLLERSM